MKFEEEYPTLAQWKKKDKAIGPINKPEHMKGHIYYWNEINAACIDRQILKEKLTQFYNTFVHTTKPGRGDDKVLEDIEITEVTWNEFLTEIRCSDLINKK